MSTTPEHDARVASLTFASVYPHYVTKVEKKGRTKEELHEVLEWLTGFNEDKLNDLIDRKATFKEFFDEAILHPNAESIKGVICGYRIEEIETPLTRQARYMDKLVDELAKGRRMEKSYEKNETSKSNTCLLFMLFSNPIDGLYVAKRDHFEETQAANQINDTLIVPSDTTVEYRLKNHFAKTDSNYAVVHGIAFNPLKSHRHYKVELEDAYQVNFICIQLKDSASKTEPKITPEGLDKVTYKGQNLTEMSKSYLKSNREGFVLNREFKHQSLTAPLYVSVKEGYMIIVRRDYILKKEKLD